MLISEINPFIRFAQPVTLSEDTNTTISYDSRLFYILHGQGNLYVKNNMYNIRSGCLLLWHGGTPYRFSIFGNINMIALNFDFTQVNTKAKDSIIPVHEDDFSKDRITEQTSFSDYDILNSPIILYDMQHTITKINLLVIEFAKKKLCYDAMCSSVLKELIIEIVRASQMNIPENSKKVDALLQYMEKNYNRDISNTELASIVGYHSYHLNRLMKDVTGMSLHQYLLYLRIEKAKNYLLNTDHTIAQISDLCGFKSAYHFSNAFKKRVFVTPSHFRKSRKNIL